MKADFEKGTKVCSKCKRELPISEFYKCKIFGDGLHNRCKKCQKEYMKKYVRSERGKQSNKRRADRCKNTFGRKGSCRGGNILVRDYELTEDQLKRRNEQRKYRNFKPRTNNIGVLVWYDRTLDSLSSYDYLKIEKREYMRQRMCAIRGYVGKVKPSEHFLFDFDLEQMLKDNVYYTYCGGKKRYYTTKWWDGEIRHWTVNDGIWRK